MRTRIAGIHRRRKGKCSSSTPLRGSAHLKPTPPCKSPDRSLDAIQCAQSRDTQTINPSLLLLSAPVAKCTAQSKISLITVDAHITSARENAAVLKQEQYENSSDCHNERSSDRRYQSEYIVSSNSPQIAQSPLTEQLRELGKRLEGNRSRSYISFIASIMSYSSAGSSTWSSLMSYIPSQESKAPIHEEVLSADRVNEVHEFHEFQTQIATKRLSTGEQMIWDELIDDTKFSRYIEVLPDVSYTSLTRRPCCQLKLCGIPLEVEKLLTITIPSPCGTCGFAIEHGVIEAITMHGTASQLESYYHAALCVKFPKGLNRNDKFGNTPLHFLAASRWATMRGILYLIERGGVNINATNTAGKTFMHVLNVSKFIDWRGPKEYLELAKYLSPGRFRIWQKDCYGNTIPQKFINAKRDLTSGQLTELEEVRKVWAADYHRNSYHTTTAEDLRPICEYSALFPYSLMTDCGVELLPSTSLLKDAEKRTLYIIQRNWTATGAVDGHKDNLLNWYLKSCGRVIDEMTIKDFIIAVLNNGADIHMRDQSGNTMLTTACCRGLRLVVKVLLLRGANVHARNHKGQGILSQSRKFLRQAKAEKDDLLYAKTLSCINAIVDAGGVQRPTDIDEWATHSLVREA